MCVPKKREELKGGAEMTQTILNVRRAHPNLKPSPSVWLYVCPYFAFPPSSSSSFLLCPVETLQLSPYFSWILAEPSWKEAWKRLCVDSAVRPSVHPLPFLFVLCLPYLLPCFLLDCFSSIFDVFFLRFAYFGYRSQLCSLLTGRRA